MFVKSVMICMGLKIMNGKIGAKEFLDGLMKEFDIEDGIVRKPVKKPKRIVHKKKKRKGRL